MIINNMPLENYGMQRKPHAKSNKKLAFKEIAVEGLGKTFEKTVKKQVAVDENIKNMVKVLEKNFKLKFFSKDNQVSFSMTDKATDNKEVVNTVEKNIFTEADIGKSVMSAYRASKGKPSNV